jgi:hypothetical protein
MSPPYLCPVLPHYNGSGVRRALTFGACQAVPSILSAKSPHGRIAKRLKFPTLKVLEDRGMRRLSWVGFRESGFGADFRCRGCVSGDGRLCHPADRYNDPLEGMNRAFFDFNQG